MSRIALSMLTLGLTLAVVGSGCAARVNPKKTKTVAEIEKLGGACMVDEDSPGKPVIRVDFLHADVTDAGLVHLKGLTELQSLDLMATNVSDAGLEHLRGLTRLQSLNLMATKVTDAGVKDLQMALPNCKINR